MGYSTTDGPTGKGLGSVTTTPSTQSDFMKMIELIGRMGNRRVGTSAQRTALSGSSLYKGLLFKDTDNGRSYEHTGSGFRPAGISRLGSTRVTTPATVAATPSWTDVASVTATSLGGVCTVKWSSRYYNPSSGAARTIEYRLTADGTQIGGIILLDVPITAGTNGFMASWDEEHTPAAGAHTWVLQARGSIASAVNVANSVLVVEEM